MAREPADLERRLQNVTEKLLAAYEELDFVHSMAGVLARPEGVDDVDDYLLRETRTIFRADGGWVARKTADGRLKTTAFEGLPETVAEFLNQNLVEPLSQKGSLPYLVDDLHGAWVRQPERFRKGATPPGPSEIEDFPRAFLVAPLTVSTEVLGVVCLGKQIPGDVFTAGESKLLSTLAIQAAMFMKNVDKIQHFRAEAQSLGRRVQELESNPRGHPDISWIRGPSPAMHRVSRQVEQAATTDATVLLLGESGTGKSLVARILHHLSARARHSFVEVNCGAVPPGLIESELFGHARGAFTGADRARSGLFEEADQGTIFLDEVAELPLEAQVKLLAVLEQHKVRRVGENKDRTVRVRVVAATNADLAVKVREGGFREDLYYRLNVINLTVPPLRQRKEDILHLARKFLIELARETNRRVHEFSPAAEKALLEYPWPGNVRELRNVVERSLLLNTRENRVEAVDLPQRGPAGIVHDSTSAQVAVELGNEPLPRAVQDFEKGLILSALQQSGGVVAAAAKALGVSRTNLHNKLRKHGLVRVDSWGDKSH